jgi:signal peptidase
MSRTTATRALGGAVMLCAIGVAVIVLWPVQLGGWTGYAIVDGTSMEPGLSTGDLVLTRKRSDYAVGDAVLYESALLDANVLHRVVAEQGGRFTFRGDNREQDDPEALPASEILGAQWLALPGVGAAVLWLKQPLVLAALAFVLVFVVLGTGSVVARRRRRGVDPLPVAVEPNPPPATGAGVGRALLVAGGVALVAFGALALMGWRSAETTTRDQIGAYAHTGVFAYEAEARRGVAYPDGVVTTGQPVFRRLSDRVVVTFDYRLESDAPADVQGGIGLDAVLSDGSGWTRTLVLSPERPFEGSAGRVEGVLELRRLGALEARFNASTGSRVDRLQVTVLPRVRATGYAGDTVLDEAFEPELPFVLDDVALRLSEPSAAPGEETPTTSPMLPRAEGEGTVSEPAVLSLGPVSATVSDVRSIGLIGLLVALGALVIGAALLARSLQGSEGERIEARYGSRIVRARVTVPEGRWVTDVDDIETLIRLAEAYDRVVLRVAGDNGDTYLVDDGIAVYRWQPPSAGALGAPRALPARGR